MVIITVSIIGVTIIICSFLLAKVIIAADKQENRANAAMNTLLELVDTLNKTFPGSSLEVIEDEDVIKLRGQLKYYKPS